MDYKQKYEQSLERAKKWSLTHKLCIEDVFPELAESEGERTRKELICFLSELNVLGKNTNFDRWNKANCAKWITWLEKQDKQKPIWTDNDRIMAFTLLRDIDQITYISNEGKNERLEWLNSLEDRFNNI